MGAKFMIYCYNKQNTQQQPVTMEQDACQEHSPTAVPSHSQPRTNVAYIQTDGTKVQKFKTATLKYST